MAVTWAQVVLVAPECAGVTDTAAQNLFLGFAADRCNPKPWGSRLDQGVTYLAAHLAVASGAGRAGGSGGAAGPVVGQTLGPMSVTYASLAGLYKDLGAAAMAYAETAYGRQYLALVKLLPSSLGLVP